MKFQPLGWLPKGGIVVLAALATWAASFSPFSQVLDQALHDALLRSGPAVQPPADVVIVDIDETSLREIGPWPWPRAVIAELVSRIDDQKPRVQAWDIFFPESMPGDEQLAKAVASAQSPLVLGQVLVLDPKVQSPPQLGQRVAWGVWPQQACSAKSGQELFGHLGLAPRLAQARAAVGHLSATPEPDGRLRQLPALVCSQGRQYPQFALAIAAASQQGLLNERPVAVTSRGGQNWLQVGKLEFPFNASGQIPVPFRYSHTAWQAVSASSLLLGEPLPTGLAGRTVLVGATALGVGDRVVSPFHPNAPGVTVHAELLAAATLGLWRLPLGFPSLYAIGLVSLGLVLALHQYRRPRSTSSLAFASLALLAAPLVLAGLGQFFLLVLMPIAAPVVGILVGLLAVLLIQVELHRRQVLRLASHLQSFLPESLAQEIARQDPSGESLGRPGQGLVVAVQVRGLQHWTQGVDSLKALALVHALSSLADRVARTHGGQLEYRQADCLYLVFAHGSSQQTPFLETLFSQLLRGMQPLTRANENLQRPLGLQIAAEEGPYLLAVAGAQASRRPLLLGPVIDTVQSILGISEDLASPIILGPDAAEKCLASRTGLQPKALGSFLLQNQAEAKMLYSFALPHDLLPLPNAPISGTPARPEESL